MYIRFSVIMIYTVLYTLLCCTYVHYERQQWLTRQMLTALRGKPENACTYTINIFDDS